MYVLPGPLVWVRVCVPRGGCHHTYVLSCQWTTKSNKNTIASTARDTHTPGKNTHDREGHWFRFQISQLYVCHRTEIRLNIAQSQSVTRGAGRRNTRIRFLDSYYISNVYTHTHTPNKETKSSTTHWGREFCFHRQAQINLPDPLVSTKPVKWKSHSALELHLRNHTDSGGPVHHHFNKKTQRREIGTFEGGPSIEMKPYRTKPTPPRSPRHSRLAACWISVLPFLQQPPKPQLRHLCVCVCLCVQIIALRKRHRKSIYSQFVRHLNAFPSCCREWDCEGASARVVVAVCCYNYPKLSQDKSVVLHSFAGLHLSPTCQLHEQYLCMTA